MAFSIDGKNWQDYRSSTLSGESYGGTPKGAPLYDYSFGQVRDAAQALGIKNINRKSEVEAVLNRIRNPVAAAPAPATQAQAQTQPAQ
ncbi:MAG: hypothetical protein O2984_06460, partial [Bacteroidetes bacterium]|nr:hypothetical protein [Bacteroidota bacterium]